MMMTPLVLMLAAPTGTQAAPDPPIACHAKALDPEGRKRQQALLKSVRARVQETKELPDGCAVRLPADAAVFREAAEWVSLERKCCGFAEFAIEWKRDNTVWVRVTGAPGAKKVLAAEMGLAAQ